MDKIKTILLKEWAEVFKNRMVLFSVAFLPLILTALPLIILYTMGGEVASVEGMDSATGIPAEFLRFCPEGLTTGECFQVYLVSQFTVMFMLLPLMIPATISSYSIVGEKTTRSLEPLLATPITTAELLLGKGLAAAIPAVIATIAAFGIFAGGAWIMLSNKAVFFATISGPWLLAVLVIGPLMSIMAVMFSIIVSSRVNDPRVAEQISAVMVIPVLAVFFGQLAGLFLIDNRIILIGALLMIVVDVLITYLAVRLFQRETILTRWQ